MGKPDGMAAPEKRVGYYQRRFVIAVVVTVAIAYGLLLLILAGLVLQNQRTERIVTDNIVRNSHLIICSWQANRSVPAFEECVHRRTGVDLKKYPTVGAPDGVR